MVLDAKDRPVMSIGAAGGPTIISQVLLGLLSCLDHDMSPSAALALPRFHHQWRPDQIRLEASMPEMVKDALRAFGHKLDEQKEFGACQIIAQGKDGTLTGASDPRVPGAAGITATKSE
jgi:gamma-glutamyltranspeptidase/glutathione hydrolase